MQSNKFLLAEEMQGLRKILGYLTDGNSNAFSALLFIKSNYKEWPKMILWLKNNNLTGQKLVEFFENASPDGGGYHMGATHILSRIKGHKNTIVGIKADELH